MVAVTCLHCGVPLVSRRRDAKWCSDRCRKRGAGRGVAADAVRVRVEGPVTVATRAALAEVGQEHMPRGAAAVALALSLDNSHRDTGSAVAALARQLGALLESVSKDRGAGSVAALRDELAARRAQRAARWPS